MLKRRGTTDPPDGAFPLPANLRSVLADRLAALPVDVVELLQRVELLHDRSVDAVRRMAAAEGLEDALDGAVRAGVLETAGGLLTFSHALLASAVRSLSGPARRAALHRRLAELEPNAEARGLHLALSAAGADDEVAAELSSAAARAAARGASETAARLAEHAARLTPESDEAARAGRVVAAAEHHIAAGDPVHARSLLSTLVASLGPGPVRA